MNKTVLWAGPGLIFALCLSLSIAVPYLPLSTSLNVICAVFIIFLLPGIYWVPLLCKSGKHSCLHILITAFPVSILGTGIATTALKLTGLTITMGNLLGAVAILSLVGIAFSWKRYSRMTIEDDFTPLALPLISALVLCISIFALFHNYFTSEPAAYWSLDEGEGVTGGDISNWSFPEQDSPVTFRHAGPASEEAPRSIRITGDRALIVMQNPSTKDEPYYLHLLLQHAAPLTADLTLNGVSCGAYTLRKFIPLTCEQFIPYVCRQGIEEKLLLRPGSNELTLRFSQGAIPSRSAPLYLENLSGVRKPAFADYMNARHQLIRLGPFYDAMEALDFATNLRTKPFLYTWDLRSGLPGYTTANQPLEFYTDMLALALIAPGLSSIKLLFLGKLFFLFLVAAALIKIDNADFSRRATLFYLPVLFAQACILVNFRHVEAADTLLSINFLLMCYFLRRGDRLPFVIAAFFTVITRNQGILLVALCVGAYAVAYRDIKRCARYFSTAMLVALVYAFVVLSIGYRHNLLGYWKQDMFFENFYRFSNDFNYSWRTRFDFATFNGWILMASCGYPLLLFLRKDRVSWFLLLAIIPYYLIVCRSAYMKIYYTVLFANVLDVIVLRSWLQMGDVRVRICRGTRRGRPLSLKTAAGWGLGGLAVLFAAVSLFLPPTDPDFNSRFPYVTHYLMKKGFTPLLKRLY